MNVDATNRLIRAALALGEHESAGDFLDFVLGDGMLLPEEQRVLVELVRAAIAYTKAAP